MLRADELLDRLQFRSLIIIAIITRLRVFADPSPLRRQVQHCAPYRNLKTRVHVISVWTIERDCRTVVHRHYNGAQIGPLKAYRAEGVKIIEMNQVILDGKRSLEAKASRQGHQARGWL